MSSPNIILEKADTSTQITLRQRWSAQREPGYAFVDKVSGETVFYFKCPNGQRFLANSLFASLFFYVPITPFTADKA